MQKPYAEVFMRKTERSGAFGAAPSYVCCNPADATRVEIIMRDQEYACRREFCLETQAAELDDYKRALEWAFRLGRKKQAADTANALQQILSGRIDNA